MPHDTVYPRQRVSRAIVIVPWYVRALVFQPCLLRVLLCAEGIYTFHRYRQASAQVFPRPQQDIATDNMLSKLRASTILGALRYKPEGRGFDS